MPAIDSKQTSRAEFSCCAPDASSVFLVGKFGHRKTDFQPMARGEDGEWSKVLDLPPGVYHYKFVVVYRGVLNMPDGCPALTAGWDRLN